MNRLAPFAIMAALALPAAAQSIDTPQCRADLQRAGALIEAVSKRDRAGPISDSNRLCAVLRQNRTDMAAATTIIERCMTGHALRENAGQMRASLEDVDAAIARRCR